mgnify:CR=1 FL=1
MYYILVKYYYHNNTLYAPEDGPMKDTWGKKLTFKSLDEARSFLASIDVEVQITQQTYTTSGWYSLAHGEYDRPDYQIRKSRGEKKKTLFPDEELPTIGFRGNSKIIIPNGEQQ